jgi:hypothetical protein
MFRERYILEEGDTYHIYDIGKGVRSVNFKTGFARDYLPLECPFLDRIVKYGKLIWKSQIIRRVLE